MTNPYGYYNSKRTESLFNKDGKFSNPKDSIKDINRDFPYLVKPEECMETIGARLVNELFISHLFSLALTLHGGTESLTYPFGSPNHLKTNEKQDFKLKRERSGFISSSQNEDDLNGSVKTESTESPDLSATSCMLYYNIFRDCKCCIDTEF
jgi:hypothetical protein